MIHVFLIFTLPPEEVSVLLSQESLCRHTGALATFSTLPQSQLGKGGLLGTVNEQVKNSKEIAG